MKLPYRLMLACGALMFLAGAAGCAGPSTAEKANREPLTAMCPSLLSSESDGLWLNRECTAQLGEMAARVACEAGDGDGCALLVAHLMSRSLPSQAQESARRACELGSQRGCLLQAFVRLPRSSKRTAHSAIDDMKAMCKSGVGLACHSYGAHRQQTASSPHDFKLAAGLYKRACEAGTAAGCTALGRMYESGTGVSADEGRAAKLYELGCDRGDHQGCVKADQVLAAEHLDSPALVFGADGREFMRVADVACDQGARHSCILAARVAETGMAGRDAALDVGANLARYRRACNLGSTTACDIAKQRAASQLDDAGSRRIEEDAKQARELRSDEEATETELRQARRTLLRPCNLGDAQSCYAVGHMIEEGQGADETFTDWPGVDPLEGAGAATSIFARACEFGLAKACVGVAARFYHGIYVPHDRERGLKFYKKACYAGHNDACNWSARVIAYESNDEPALDEAREFLGNACNTGVERACYWKARHQVTGELLERAPQEGWKTLLRWCGNQSGLCMSATKIFQRADFEVDVQTYLDANEPVCKEGDFLACLEWVEVCSRTLEAGEIVPQRLVNAARTSVEVADFAALSLDVLLRRAPRTLGDLDLFALMTTNCEEGAELSCVLAAEMKWLGYQTERDRKAALADLQEMCGTERFTACTRLEWFQDILQGEAALAEAAEKCEQQDASACYRVGLTHQYRGTDVERFEDASTYFEQACELGHEESCDLLRRNRPVLPPESGRRYFKIANEICEEEGAEECFKRGRYIAEWYNFAKGVELVRTGCEGGHEEACEFLRYRGLEVPESEE